MSRSAHLAQRGPDRPATPTLDSRPGVDTRPAVKDPSAQLLQLKPVAGATSPAAAKKPPTADAPVQTFAGPAMNDKDDIAIAGISFAGKHEVHAVPAKQAYAPPLGWSLDCFVFRNGWGTKFVGAAGTPVQLFPALVKQMFTKYFDNAMAEFAKHPPKAATSTSEKTSAKPVHRLAAPALALSPAATADVFTAHQANRGQTLPTAAKRRMESTLGTSLDHVRVHTGTEADTAAQGVGAKAFATGSNVFFRSGEYQPNTFEGKKLLAHEVAHTVQQSRGSATATNAGLSVNTPGDRFERDADRAADRIVGSKPAAVEPVTPAPVAMIARTPASPPPAAPPPGGDTVQLRGGEAIELSSLPGGVQKKLTDSKTADVRARVGTIADGTLKLQLAANDTVVISKAQGLHLSLKHLERLKSLDPVLAVQTDAKTGVVLGFATTRSLLSARNGLADAIHKQPTLAGWMGITVKSFALTAANQLEGEKLTVQSSELSFHLGGFIAANGSFGFINEQVTYSATGTATVGKHTGTVTLSREEDGVLRGNGNLALAFERVQGDLVVKYEKGTVDARGVVNYDSEKLKGKLTVVVTDRESADNFARAELGVADGLTKGGAGAEAAAPVEGEGMKLGPRGIAGMGELDFAFTEWMTGKAKVLIDNKGNVTIKGEIAPPAEVILFPQKDYEQKLFEVEARAPYGLPVVGNVFAFANVGLSAQARIGPAKLSQIVVKGTYSTDPAIRNQFSIAGSLNISAYAGLKLRGEGGVGLQILAHDVKVGAGIWGMAGIKGYVDARPEIGYREPTPGSKGEFYLNGHMEIAAQPFLGLGGDVFIELHSPLGEWLSKKWTWPLGQKEYPIGEALTLGADVDYIIGSKDVPKLELSKPKFDGNKFMTDILSDKAPNKSGQGDKEQAGNWGDKKSAPTPAPAAGGKKAPPAPGGGKGAGKPAIKPAGTGPGKGPKVTEKKNPKAGQGDPKKPKDAKTPPKGDKKPDAKADPKTKEADEKAKRWEDGKVALNTLAATSRQSEMTIEELDRQLNKVKGDYKYKKLELVFNENEWDVDASMSPEKTIDTNGKVNAKTGKTPDQAIPIPWYKPVSRYESIVFHDDKGVKRMSFKAPYTYTLMRGGRSMDLTLGVADKYLPRKNKRMQRAKPARTGAVSQFRKALKEFDFDWKGLDADHVQELQVGGDDVMENIWPLDSGTNRSAGSLLNQEVVYQMPESKSGGKQKPKKKTVGDLAKGTWLVIKEIRS